MGLPNNWNSFIKFSSECSYLPKGKNKTVQFSCSVMSDSLRPHGLQHPRPPCPSASPRVCPSSCPLNRWCHRTVSSSVTLFSFCLQSLPASGSFPMSQLFASGGQWIGASALASVLPVSIQGWFLLGLTGLISLLSKELLYMCITLISLLSCLEFAVTSHCNEKQH